MCHHDPGAPCSSCNAPYAPARARCWKRPGPDARTGTSPTPGGASNPHMHKLATGLGAAMCAIRMEAPDSSTIPSTTTRAKKPWAFLGGAYGARGCNEGVAARGARNHTRTRDFPGARMPGAAGPKRGTSAICIDICRHLGMGTLEAHLFPHRAWGVGEWAAVGQVAGQ